MGTVAGEWTGGITDCAKWLNGKDKGARYDGTFSGSSKVGDCTGKYTGSVANLSSADKYNIGRLREGHRLDLLDMEDRGRTRMGYARFAGQRYLPPAANGTKVPRPVWLSTSLFMRRLLGAFLLFLLPPHTRSVSTPILYTRPVTM